MALNAIWILGDTALSAAVECFRKLVNKGKNYMVNRYDVRLLFSAPEESPNMLIRIGIALVDTFNEQIKLP